MKKSVNLVFYEIMNKNKDIQFRFTNETVPWCHIPEKIIYICCSEFSNPTVEGLFDLLHEIGHIRTNTKGMKRCEEEFYATQWAIKEMKKYGYVIPAKRKNEFQNYIWEWRERSFTFKGKNIPSKEKLTLVW
jgi:hypothetical protein